MIPRAGPWRRIAYASLAGVAVIGASLVICPEWPLDWLRAISHSPHIIAPVTLLPLGPLVVLALLRWRRSEARLLAVMACVPHTVVLYETLPLFLIPETRFELLVLVLLSDLAFGVGYFLALRMVHSPADLAAYVRTIGHIIVALLYLPCVVMVLRRPNVGAVPEWLESGARRFESAIRAGFAWVRS